jgi:DHA2 family multidrug resistance protein
LSQQKIANGSGIYNLTRNLGGSIGIAFVTTMLARGAQVHQALMVSHLTPFDPPFAQQLAAARQALMLHADPATATTQAYSALYGILNQQANLWAFVDNFYLFGLLALAGLPMLLLLQKVKRPAKVQGGH